MKILIKGIIIIHMAFIVGCCRDDPLNIGISPDKSKWATASFNDCSGTCRVKIENAPGYKGAKTGTILIIEGSHPLWLTWEGDKKLVVEGLENAKERLKLQQYDGIEIEYKSHRTKLILLWLLSRDQYDVLLCSRSR